VRTALVLVILAMHGCDPGTAPLLLPDAHRAEIERQQFMPVARVGDLPNDVQAAVRLLPGSSPALADPATVPTPDHGLILLACAEDHCIIHYERRGLFYVVLLGVASRVLVEWQGLVPGPLAALTDAKAVALQPAHASRE
jgi:hypothetical protein